MEQSKLKPEECRIGNILENGYVVTIQYVDGVLGFFVTQSLFSSGHRWKFVRLSDLKPAILTEDWLIRFGFEIVFDGSGTEFKSEYSINDRTINYCDGFCYVYSGLGSYEDYGLPIAINYVHQLQNLYFALTGEELTIKEESKQPIIVSNGIINTTLEI